MEKNMEIIFKGRNSGKTTELKRRIIEYNIQSRNFHFAYIGAYKNQVQAFKQEILNLIPIGTGINHHLPIFTTHNNCLKGMLGRHLDVIYIDDISLKMINYLHLLQPSTKKFVMVGSLENLIEDTKNLFASISYFNTEIKMKTDELRIIYKKYDMERLNNMTLGYDNYNLRKEINKIEKENFYLRNKLSIFSKLKDFKNKIIKIIRRI